MQRHIEDPLSEELLLERYQPGDTIVAELDGENVIFKKKENGPPKKKEKALATN